MHTLVPPFTRLLQAIRRAARRLHHLAAQLVARVHHEAATAWARHTRRVSTDRPYRRTLTAALAAVATTIAPHPAIAAALGAWLAEPPHVSRWTPTDDEPDDGPPWRAPRRWDTLGRP